MSRPLRFLVAAMAAGAATGAVAADLLPLKNGIFVPVGVACKGASNADMVTYWGGRSSIGAAQETCTITSMTKHGNAYRLANRCKDVQGGDSFVADPTVLTITNPSAFSMGGTRYRYCGPRAQF